MTKTRNVEVQLQRWAPELCTVIVAVPADWADEQVETVLPAIYAEASKRLDPYDWYDQEDFDSREGDHEIRTVTDISQVLDEPLLRINERGEIEDSAEEDHEIEPTGEQVRAYIAAEGFRCPFCTSDEIEAEAEYQTSDERVTNEVRCLNCRRSWHDVYTLAAVCIEGIDGECHTTIYPAAPDPVVVFESEGGYLIGDYEIHPGESRDAMDYDDDGWIVSKDGDDLAFVQTEALAVNLAKAQDYRDCLASFVGTIDVTGGVILTTSGCYVPVGDSDWIDLGDCYVAACEALGQQPKITAEKID